MIDKRVNSHEIARIAGVSRSTVSRVINNSNTVKIGTRDRVLQIIRDYDYSPDFSAQMLAGKPSNTIGLFFASNRNNNKMNAEDLLVDFMLERIIEIASDHDYFVLARIIRNFNEESSKLKIREMFAQRRIDAGIFIGFPNYFSPIEEMVALGHVVGIMDQNIPGRNEPNRIIVNFDNNTMEDGVDYLYSLGHRKILAVLGDKRRYNGIQKEEAFYRAMKRLDLKRNKEWILRGNFNRMQAHSEMEKFLKSQHKGMPTAVLCACDDMAYGVMEVLDAAGLKIPEDLSVVGIDDSFMSKHSNPALTTFRVNFDEMLRKLTENVIACIQNPFTKPQKFTFGSEIVIRNSCQNMSLNTQLKHIAAKLRAYEV